VDALDQHETEQATTMITNDQVQMMTIEEAATFVSHSERTVRRWIKSGDLAAHLFGRRWRISRADLIDFLRRHRRT
jgi:excisionase family DNA binding protein